MQLRLDELGVGSMQLRLDECELDRWNWSKVGAVGKCEKVGRRRVVVFVMGEKERWRRILVYYIDLDLIIHCLLRSRQPT